MGKVLVRERRLTVGLPCKESSAFIASSVDLAMHAAKLQADRFALLAMLPDGPKKDKVAIHLGSALLSIVDAQEAVCDAINERISGFCQPSSIADKDFSAFANGEEDEEPTYVEPTNGDAGESAPAERPIVAEAVANPVDSILGNAQAPEPLYSSAR